MAESPQNGNRQMGGPMSGNWGRTMFRINVFWAELPPRHNPDRRRCETPAEPRMYPAAWILVYWSDPLSGLPGQVG
jgi:hypothetical protein